MGRWLAVFLFLFTLSLSAWAIDGTFQGRVVDSPADQHLDRGWIYIQGRNRLLRRVEISHASIVLAEGVLVGQKRKCNLDCIAVGQEVRITAEQDRQGEWRAKRVEIIKEHEGLAADQN